jgi:hypothetical protein
MGAELGDHTHRGAGLRSAHRRQPFTLSRIFAVHDIGVRQQGQRHRAFALAANLDEPDADLPDSYLASPRQHLPACRQAYRDMAARPIRGECVKKTLLVPSPKSPQSLHLGVYKGPEATLFSLHLDRNFLKTESIMNTTEYNINNIHNMLIYQEETLQSTRNLHYVFQAIFLGSSLGISAVIYALVFGLSDSEIPKTYIKLSSLILIIFCSITIFTGYSLMNQYSKLIYRRGIIVDFIQHLRILNSIGALEKTISAIFEKTPNDYVFILCKIAERITNQNEETMHVPNHFGNHYIDSYSSKSNLTKTFRTFGYFNSSLILYILYYNDIYYAAYDISKLNSNTRKRKISSTRNGHKIIFTILWIMATFVIFVPIIFTLKGVSYIIIL